MVTLIPCLLLFFYLITSSDVITFYDVITFSVIMVDVASVVVKSSKNVVGSTGIRWRQQTVKAKVVGLDLSRPSSCRRSSGRQKKVLKGQSCFFLRLLAFFVVPLMVEVEIRRVVKIQTPGFLRRTYFFPLWIWKSKYWKTNWTFLLNFP